MRDVVLDRLRGLAILLMVLDHVLLVSDRGLLWRWTLTRASLPLFMLVAGFLLRDRDGLSARRYVELWLAAVVSTLVVWRIPGMSKVNVLVVFALGVALWPVARRWPVETIVGCLVWIATWPAFWPGYHPAEVLGLMVCGVWALQPGSVVRRAGEMLPRFLEVYGRWPLTWYVGHLCVLLFREYLFRGTW